MAVTLGRCTVRFRDRPLQAFAWILLIWLTALGCSGERRPAETVGPALKLHLGAALPPPGVQESGVPAVVRTMYQENALSLDRNGRVQPKLFQKWEWLADGTILRLTLPEGILFHDGSHLTADVAADLLRRRIEADVRDGSAFTFNAVSHLTADADASTVDIHLRRREPFLPDDLVEVSMTIGPKGTIGTGPFMLDGGPPTNAGGRLRAFSAYRLGQAQVDSVEVKGYPTLRAAWTAMMRGEINMLHEVSSDAAQFVEAESSLRTYPFVRPYTYFVGFNVRHPILRHREVRQALSQAIDRAAIIRDGMKGKGEIADGPIWKYHWAYSTAQRTYDYNPDAANLRLDAAGYDRANERTPDRMPSRFRFTCLMFGGDSRFERVALVLQKQLYDIGIDMQIEALPIGELVTRMQTGRFDAVLMEVISGKSLSWTYRIWRSPPPGAPVIFNTGYSSADESLDRLRSASTELEIRSAVAELQRVLYEDPPALFLAWPTVSRAVSADIEVPYEPNSDIVSRVARFQRATQGITRQ